MGIKTILYTLSFHLCERELCRQKRVRAFMAAAPFPILSVMLRLGLPSCDMIIPRYLALSTTLTAVGGGPRGTVEEDVLVAVDSYYFALAPI